MSNSNKSILITDLDNTLFDWVHLWHECFVAMLDSIVEISAALGFLLEKGLSIEMGPLKILYASFIPLIGIVATFLFYFIDRYWYHRLLIGSVTQGLSIEKTYRFSMPELGLTRAIGDASPVRRDSAIVRAI